MESLSPFYLIFSTYLQPKVSTCTIEPVISHGSLAQPALFKAYSCFAFTSQV